MKPQWICTTPAKPWSARPLPPAATPAGDGLALHLTEARHQIWEGTGGCFNELGWLALAGLPARARDGVLRALFDPAADSCRFNLCRLPIGASDYAAQWYSLNETPGDLAMRRFTIARDRQYLIPYARAALALRPDLRLFASPWSPPTWLKHPPVYNYGTLVWRPAVLRAYALYFVRYLQAYRRAGVRVHQIHPQNEPVADQKFPSCLWTGAQLREFIRDYLAPAFAAHKLDTEIWLGTLNTDDYDGFIATVLDDPAARRLIAGVGFQWAGKGAVARTAASWPGVRLMQTENECGDGRNSWEYAHYIFRLWQHYVTHGVNAYVYWNLVLAAGGQSTWGWRQNSLVTIAPDGAVTYTPEFYVMKHVGRYVTPGARRLGLAGAWAGNAFAFENPDGTRVVLCHNSRAEPRPLTVVDGARAWALSVPAGSFNTFVLPAARGCSQL